MSVNSRVEVVPIVLEPIANADNLALVRIGSYQVVVNKGDWVGVAKGAHVVPDSVVDTTRPEFSWLPPESPSNPLHRVRARRFRGVWSHGLLVPVADDVALGTDLAPTLGVVRYEPPAPSAATPEADRATSAPPGFDVPVYDLEPWRKYHSSVFTPGESVIVTEKVHGCNGRWLYHQASNSFFAGSHYTWKQEHPDNLWWKVLHRNEGLKAFLRTYPNTCVYGEVYGQVQDLDYGTAPNERRLAVFDVLLPSREWANWDKAKAMLRNFDVELVPEVYRGAHDANVIAELAEGPTRLMQRHDVPAHIREGVVVRSLFERAHPLTSRAVLKLVSNSYLER